MGLKLGFPESFVRRLRFWQSHFSPPFTRLQGILITGTGLALFIGAMVLIPRCKLERTLRGGLPDALATQS
jgi:hypothetical protein